MSKRQLRITLSVFAACLTVSSVLVSVLLDSPADAQTFLPGWSPDPAQVFESDGVVVLALGKSGPGHVRYESQDGSCKEDNRPGFSNPSANCKEPAARAPDDYEAVSGDLVFPEAGSKTISIKIVDDNLHEGSEAFSVYAHEGNRQAGWTTGHIGVVWILDDESNSRTPGSSTSSGRSSQPAAGSRAGSSASQPSTVPASSGSMDFGNHSGDMNQDVSTSAGAKGETDRSAAEEVRNGNERPSFSLRTGLATLLFVTIAAAWFWLKKRLGRRLT